MGEDRGTGGDAGYDKASGATSAGGIASILQTIKPDEARRLYIAVRGDATTVAAGSTARTAASSARNSGWLSATGPKMLVVASRLGSPPPPAALALCGDCFFSPPVV